MDAVMWARAHKYWAETNDGNEEDTLEGYAPGTLRRRDLKTLKESVCARLSTYKINKSDAQDGIDGALHPRTRPVPHETNGALHPTGFPHAARAVGFEPGRSRRHPAPPLRNSSTPRARVCFGGG